MIHRHRSRKAHIYISLPKHILKYCSSQKKNNNKIQHIYKWYSSFGPVMRVCIFNTVNWQWHTIYCWQRRKMTDLKFTGFRQGLYCISIQNSENNVHYSLSNFTCKIKSARTSLSPLKVDTTSLQWVFISNSSL